MDEQEQRKERIENFFKKKTFWIVIGILFLIFLAWHIRTSNVQYLKDVTTNEYTLGPDLDPFLFLRYAKIINEQGGLPSVDNFRYVPLGYSTVEETQLLPYLIVYFHKIFSIISGKSIEYSAVIFPVFMFLITVIAFYLLIRKIFEENKRKNWIAFISSLFLVVSPSLLARTVAGIPEKESAGFFFLFLAFYLFLCSWKEENMKRSLVYGALAGLSTACMGLIWGGWIYVFVTIALFVFIGFLFGEVNKRRFLAYSLWFLLSIIVPPLFSARFSIKGLAVSTSTGLSTIIFAFLLIDYLLFNTKIKDYPIVEKARKKVPDRVLAISTAIVLGLVLSTLFFGVGFVPSFFTDITEHLTHQYTDRLSFTVAENRQPYFAEWRDSFGPTAINLFGSPASIPPLMFWLFFAGSIVLFYEIIKNLEKKERRTLLILYILFISALIFSKYSASSTLNGINAISKLFYFGSFLLLAGAFVQLFYKYYKENRMDEFKKLNYSYLFLLAYFIPGLIGARSAIRLIMALVPPVVGLIGFLSVYVVDKANEKKEEKKTLYYSLAIIVLLVSAFTFYSNYTTTSNTASSMRPSYYTQQWQQAMGWVRENTSSDSVFAHWWDYGYWVQSIGDRATVLDGGNAIPYWDHLMGRHVLTAQSEEEALEFLYTHNASYLLIDPTDIGKYGAYSRIGSDENYDRYSWIGTFSLNEQQIQEKKNQTSYFYQGGVALDEDYNYNESGKTIFLPSGGTAVGAFFVTQDKENKLNFEQPIAAMVYNGKQINIPMRYLYFKGKLYDFKKGYGGCVYIVPRVIQESPGARVSEMGSAFFLSERNMRALWVKLYLLNQDDNFELVHKEQDLIAQNVNSKFNVGDIITYYDIHGPIKIWKINYPENIKANSAYLSKDYPDSVRLDTLN